MRGIDFVKDWTADGRQLRMLVMLNECAGECEAINVRRRLRVKGVVAVLADLAPIRGELVHLWVASVPAMILKVVKERCAAFGADTRCIDAKSPRLNGIVGIVND